MQEYISVDQDEQRANEQLRAITHNTINNSLKLREVDFSFFSTLTAGQTAVFSLTDSIRRGMLLNQRIRDTIYYKQVDYTIVVDFQNTNNVQLGTSKVALIWAKKPSILAEKNYLFAQVRATGQVITGVSSSFLNTSYRKQVTVVRDSYLSTLAPNAQGKVLISVAEPNTVRKRNVVEFELEDAARKGPRLSTEYDPKSDSGAPTYGELALLFMGGDIVNLTTSIRVVGRLTFY